MRGIMLSLLQSGAKIKSINLTYSHETQYAGRKLHVFQHIVAE
ncbi:hypothetical protein [Bacillus cereus]|nr:hypothetical protein [Bacillus cereus]